MHDKGDTIENSSQPGLLLVPRQPTPQPRHAISSPSNEHAHEAEEDEDRPGRHVVGLLGEDDQQHAQQGEEGHDHTGAPAAECVAHYAHDDATWNMSTGLECLRWCFHASRNTS